MLLVTFSWLRLSFAVPGTERSAFHRHLVSAGLVTESASAAEYTPLYFIDHSKGEHHGVVSLTSDIVA